MCFCGISYLLLKKTLLFSIIIYRHPIEAVIDNPEKTKKFGEDFPIIVEFFLSLWYLIVSNSDIIVYTIIFFNQVLYFIFYFILFFIYLLITVNV